MNDKELRMKIFDWKKSWHSQYQNSPYIYVGGFSDSYTEGDLIAVFSQFGEICDINLVKDQQTGKSKGFCFIGYENQLSTILAVDNFIGIKLGGRHIMVDHVSTYRSKRENKINEKRERSISRSSSDSSTNRHKPSKQSHSRNRLSKKRRSRS